MRQPLYFHRSKRLSELEAEAMLHLGEVIAAEIYARDTADMGEVKRAEGSHETMGFVRRFFWYFSFAVERKVRTFPLRATKGRPYKFYRDSRQN